MMYPYILVLSIYLVHSQGLTLPLKSTKIKSSSAASNIDNISYYTSIGFGSPVQYFDAYISAWSPITMVPALNSECSSVKGFNSSASSSFNSQSLTCSALIELNEEAVGICATDTLSIGDNNPVMALNQDFILAYPCNISESMINGVIGLGFSQNTSSIVLGLMNSRAIPSAIFSLYLSNVGFDGSDTPEAESALLIGSYNLQLYAKDPSDGFVFHDLATLDESQWMLNLDEVRFSSLTFLQSTNVIIDPGSSYIYGPSVLIGKIFAIMQNNHNCFSNDGIFQCFCNDINNFADLEFVIDSHTYVIKSQTYQKRENGICSVFLFRNENDNSNWILGQVFLRKYYSVWSFDSRKIGFTKSINNLSSTNNTSEIWVIILVIVLIVVILGGALTILVIIYKKKKRLRDSILLGERDPEYIN